MDRREFMKGAALGVGAGVLGSMGLYSYSPLRRAFLPEVKRGTASPTSPRRAGSTTASL